mmetsp:Transcript_20700/g.36801  ORF Transcript_20700/g.36801 Transcript_20700/m.36801 type:complete len:215 (-) Transcript_20700:396-1040(-)
MQQFLYVAECPVRYETSRTFVFAATSLCTIDENGLVLMQNLEQQTPGLVQIARQELVVVLRLRDARERLVEPRVSTLQKLLSQVFLFEATHSPQIPDNPQTHGQLHLALQHLQQLPHDELHCLPSLRGYILENLDLREPLLQRDDERLQPQRLLVHANARTGVDELGDFEDFQQLVLVGEHQPRYFRAFVDFFGLLAEVFELCVKFRQFFDHFV